MGANERPEAPGRGVRRSSVAKPEAVEKHNKRGSETRRGRSFTDAQSVADVAVEPEARRRRPLSARAAREHLIAALRSADDGDFSVAVVSDGTAGMDEIARLFNSVMIKQHRVVNDLVRVSRSVGRQGKIRERASTDGLSGELALAVESVNSMIADLVQPTSEVSRVIKAVAEGDLSQKVVLEIEGKEVQGEFFRIGSTVNRMVDQLNAFASEVTRVAREVGTEGVLGGQANVPEVGGTWKDLTDSVNAMAKNLTDQVRNIALVTTAVANGDLSQKISVAARGEVLDLKDTINNMVEKLRIFANEVIRVAVEVGTEGRLGGQATVPDVAGTWKDLTENVNAMAGNLTVQVRNIADVTTAVALGDLSRKITVGAHGEILALKNTVNAMVDQLNAFASEVTRVAREVGTEGNLGGQAKVSGAAGVWRDLTDNVNGLAANLTTQVRNIADVTTAVANGDLSQKITVEAQGEVLSLKQTINNMVDRLRVFGDEVTRVAKEVGTEGKLGGQAEVPNVSGTWKGLTESVNAMANSLTVQVRNIADVTTAVTKGDLTRQITVNARGELDELKQNMNQMIGTLRETTERNQEQDWLKTNLAKFTQMLQGQKDLESVSSLIMNELTPLVSAHHGAFFIADDSGENPALSLIASYAFDTRRQTKTQFHLGEGLVGQAAREKKQILVQDVPDDYIEISSGLGAAPPRNIVILPILFEGEVRAVIELASFLPFNEIHRSFLDQLEVSLGVVLNMIQTSMRTEELLEQSQKLTHELQSSSSELRQQQDELRHVNEELEEKAKQLAEQNSKVEQKNREVEASRIALEEKAEQLSLSSRYKSEFLANMSHELRTPLNALLILAKLLSENKEGTLSPKQVEFARTIYASGTDLLTLINDILDLSKVEAGKMEVERRDVAVADVRDMIQRTFTASAEDKGLAFSIHVSPDAQNELWTDRQRLEQILKNLVSNAIKFTEHGEVTLDIRGARPDENAATSAVANAGADGVIAFAVRDTGIGIPLDKQQLIFEEFQQVNGTTSREYGGTGLGLSISRSIARLLGGEITLESKPGRGSTFTLYLPIRTPAVEPAREAPPVPPSEEPSNVAAGTEPARTPALEQAPARTDSEAGGPRTDPALAGKHILIVDDDVRNIFSLTSVLEDAGMQVSFAENGRDALTLLDSRPGIDLVLLDVMMPGMDGYETTRTIRQRAEFAELPIVTLTAKAMKGDREKSIEAGASDYIPKPVDPDRLLSVVASWLRR